MSEVKANYKASVEELKVPGDFSFGEWSNTVHLLCYICPCGTEHGGNCAIRISEHDKESQDTHQWKWNGNRESPTLTPSIHDKGCKWHGYLTDGVFKSC